MIEEGIKLRNLDKYNDISSDDLSEIVGGDNADYNMGYETGRDLRRTVNHIVRWWDQHFFTRREMN